MEHMLAAFYDNNIVLWLVVFKTDLASVVARSGHERWKHHRVDLLYDFFLWQVPLDSPYLLLEPSLIDLTLQLLSSSSFLPGALPLSQPLKLIENGCFLDQCLLSLHLEQEFLEGAAWSEPY